MSAFREKIMQQTHAKKREDIYVKYTEDQASSSLQTQIIIIMESALRKALMKLKW